MFKAVVFDIGQTLIQYNKPLNWSALYRPALEQTTANCGYAADVNDFEKAEWILKKYNTRVNPREYEVYSDVIFKEILSAWNMDFSKIEQAKNAFYSFFRNDAVLFEEAERTLKKLKERGIYTATLSDVAYGMDNRYALSDIAMLLDYIDLPLTSNDTGYRKPAVNGLVYVSKEIGVKLSEMIYVGDEEKDMVCANCAGAYAVLINRSEYDKNYGQKRTIKSLDELIEMIG